ncbi:hypothetical protein FAIPA1_450014 [Frankia sp. AiPs1]
MYDPTHDAPNRPKVLFAYTYGKGHAEHSSVGDTIEGLPCMGRPKPPITKSHHWSRQPGSLGIARTGHLTPAELHLCVAADRAD